MPNPNAIVSTVTRIEPALDKPAAELLRAERGLSVELRDGRRLRLDPGDPRSAGFAQILDAISKQRLPVYLEINPATSTIERLLIPYIARVANMRAAEEGLEVALEPSQARHVLQRGSPDFAEFEARPGPALPSARPLNLTHDVPTNHIAVRACMP